MSWECYCSEAVARGREHRPGSHIVCPYCGRTREHVDLLEVVRSLVEVFDLGEADKDTLPRHFNDFRRHLAAYRGGDGIEDMRRALGAGPDGEIPIRTEVLKAEPENVVQACWKCGREVATAKATEGEGQVQALCIVCLEAQDDASVSVEDMREELYGEPARRAFVPDPGVGPEDFRGTDEGSQYDETPSAETIRREVEERVEELETEAAAAKYDEQLEKVRERAGQPPEHPSCEVCGDTGVIQQAHYTSDGDFACAETVKCPECTRGKPVVTAAELAWSEKKEREVPRDELDARELALMKRIADHTTIVPRVFRAEEGADVRFEVSYGFRRHRTDDEWATGSMFGVRPIDALRKAAMAARSDHKKNAGLP